MSDTYPKPRRILSLKWKALIGLSLLLLAVYCCFFYLGYQTLQQQQRNHFELMTRRFANSFDNVLVGNQHTLNNLAESLQAATLQADGTDNFTSLRAHVDRHWLLLHNKWALQSMVLLAQQPPAQATWGKPLTAAAIETIAEAALQRWQPVSRFDCTSSSLDSNCSLITALPLRTSDGALLTLIIGAPITDLILDLSRDNLIETAMLIRDHKATSQLGIERWNFTLAAASDLVTSLDLLQASAADTTVSALQELGDQIVADNGQRFYLRAIVTDKIDNNSNVLLVIIDDITAQYAALRARSVQSLVAGAIAMLIAEIFLLLTLWQPMERIKWQARVLPLLADGDYHSVYSWPGNRNVKYCDELDVLEDASILLAKNLEKMGIEIRKRSRELEYIALFDVLTGLANRRSFENSLRGAIEEYARAQHGFAVLFIDLDNFKRINDSLGHHIGDELLLEISQRLRAITRSTDTVARLGGDEFIAILRHVDNPEAVLDAVRKILQTLRDPITLGMRQFNISGSIGITLAPEDGLDAATLMKNADLAMYRAKALGRNTYQFYTSVISDSAVKLLDLEIELSRALEQNQFVLFYQPIVDLPGREISGLEALVRWEHPTRGLIAPNEFIPLMEQNGMIAELDRQVIRLACRDSGFLQQQTGRALTLSINLSSNELRDTRLVEFLREQITATGIHPSRLKLEITESALMEDVDNAAVVLHQLKALGIRLSIDDFGTGYSSLNYLKKLPVDELKIDRSFVSDVPGESSSAEIVAAVVAMAHKLNLKVVAEGIENEQQIDFLIGCQCDFGQGYFFQRPVARASIVTWLQQVATNEHYPLREAAARLEQVAVIQCRG